MVKFAMVFMILAGIFGLPAVLCSRACASAGSAVDSFNEGLADSQNNAHLSQIVHSSRDAHAAIFAIFIWITALSSLGSIVAGALVKRLGKMPSTVVAFALALLFLVPLLQANLLGLIPALFLIVAGVVLAVASPDEWEVKQPLSV